MSVLDKEENVKTSYWYSYRIATFYDKSNHTSSACLSYKVTVGFWQLRCGIIESITILKVIIAKEDTSFKSNIDFNFDIFKVEAIGRVK